MTVAELIEKLKTFPSDHDVIFWDEAHGDNYSIEKVEADSFNNCEVILM